MAKKEESVHNNHRSRIRREALDFGMEHMPDYKVLEIFLYGCLARGDTNELAHRIIEHFGSIDALMDATGDELMRVSGVGEQTAVEIMSAMELNRRCMRARIERANDEKNVYTSLQKIAERMWTYFQGLNKERLYMLLFDNRMALISQQVISNGSINSTDVCNYAIVKHIVDKNAANVVLAHNHPHGNATPSPEDIQVTDSLFHFLKGIGIPLREHIIIADDRFSSILRANNRIPHVMAQEKVSESVFDWERFYDVDEETYRFSEALDFLKDQT